MDLSDLIKKAAQQQTGRNTQNTECIKQRPLVKAMHDEFAKKRARPGKPRAGVF